MDNGSQTSLAIDAAEARSRLVEAYERGKAFQSMPMTSDSSATRMQIEDVRTWVDVTEHLLKVVFDTDEEAKKFSTMVRMSFSLDGSPKTRLRECLEDLNIYLRRLRSVIERLDLFKGPVSAQGSPSSDSAVGGKKVFIVHGHDEGPMASVARLLERLEIEPVILSEQTNRGRTIIEKFEDEASDCRFAIALLTPDDLGRSVKDAELRHRARQNVILELGYFMARLGRGKVCALHKGDLELPSDISGILWISYDGSGWRLELAKELRDAGLNVDLNLL
ncbi:MAG: nucleotide-binding protein, partial [Sandaracinaceae bacterium]|nr:nucleotide-binding protein [Sandaracinaceae bacterium]